MFLDFQEIRDIVAYYAIIVATYLIASQMNDYRYPVWTCWVLVLLPLFLPNDSKIRQIMCFICFLIVSTVLAIPYAIFYALNSPFHPKNIGYTGWVETFLTSIFGITIELRNLENLKRYDKAIILVNHQSLIDTFVLVRLWKYFGSPKVLVKREVFYYWPIGIDLWLCGAIFVEKMVGARGWMHFMTQAKAHLNSQYKKPCIVMFPEAKRNPSKTCLLPFRKGAFRLAADMKIPIVPIVISPYHFLDNTYFRRGKAVVTILDPINEENFANTDSIDDVMINIWNLMNQVYKTPVQEPPAAGIQESPQQAIKPSS